MYDVTVTEELTYARAEGQPLRADLHRPATTEPPPVVVYVHGGGFEVGSRADGAKERLTALAAHGLAVLSVDYRLAPAARFPAQLHDVKAAVRWIRARGGDLEVDADRVAILGASAGALLASLVGLTAGDADSDGDVGEHLDRSTAVRAVVAWFGVADLLATASRSPLEVAILPFDFEAALLGVESAAEVTGVAEVADRARRASPLTWVSPDAPPFLIAHGDRDRVVPPAQSRMLHDALARAGADSSLLLLGGAGHEDPAFDAPTNLALTAAFLAAALRR